MTLARTYDAERRDRGVLAHVLPLLGYPAVIWRNRYMVQNFFRRDLMGRFHGSFLGAWWMLVQPVFLFAVYYLIFGLLYGPRTGGGPDVSFAIYLFSGVIVFHALIEASTTSCSIIVANGNLVKKVAFPSEVLPVPVAMTSLVLYFVGAVVCVACGLGFGVLGVGWSLLGVPLVMAVQFVFVLGLGLFLANANVFIRDISQLWRIISTAWMFLSPVFWYPSMLTERLGDSVLPQLLFHCNPAFPLIQAHRLALGGENPEIGLTGFWGHLGIAAAWALGFLILGYSTFVSSKHKYADVV
jgi:lipopolysaccharide transport system permease protein